MLVSQNDIPLIQQLDLLTFTILCFGIILASSLIVSIAEIAIDYNARPDKRDNHNHRNKRK